MKMKILQRIKNTLATDFRAATMINLQSIFNEKYLFLFIYCKG